MRAEGMVSVWVGWAESEERLGAFAEERYPDEAVPPPISELARAIGVDHYDEDGREAGFLQRRPAGLAEALAKVSYSERVIRELVERRGDEIPPDTNCICLLYNFMPEVDRPVATAPGVTLSFLGVVPYR